MNQSPAKNLFTADLVVNEITQQVYKNKKLINLTDLSFQTLMALISASPDVISSEDLIDQVWQDIEVSPETVTQRIAMLRKALSTDGKANDKYITSIRNKGYRWAPEVKAKNTRFLTQGKSLLLGLAILMLIPLYYLIEYHQSNDKELTPTISSQISTDEYTQQAWRYLYKHDAKNNRLAKDMFEKSLQKKPNNLDGLVGMSVALSHQVSKFNQSNTLLIQAITLAEKATKLYPGEAKTWSALGFAQDVKGDINAAILSYRKSLEINPQMSSTLGNIAYLHGIKGELIQALKMNLQILNSGLEYGNLQLAENLHLLGFLELADQWYQRADVLSPDNVFASNQRVRFLISNQRYQEAQLILDQAIARGIDRPENYTLQGILQLIGDQKDLALASFEKALVINEEDFEAQVWVLILSMEAENKIKILDRMWQDKAYYWPSDVIHKVVVYAALGARVKMLDALEAAFNQGYMNSQWLLQLPPIKPYLSDPEFLFWIDKIQQKANSQRQELLTVNWLPEGFLDPTPSNH